MTIDEVRAILFELGLQLDADLSDLWAAAGGLPSAEFRSVIIDAFPEIVLPHSATAADVAAEWYDSTPTGSVGFRVQQGALPTVERLASSVQWALNVGNAETGLTLLQGSGQRGVLDGARDTILTNVAAEPGARWARHASANACSFCRMLTTRADVYRSRSTADFKPHDDCHCIPVMVRPGQSYTPAPYVAQWEKQYVQARRDAGSSDPKAILNAWDRALRK